MKKSSVNIISLALTFGFLIASIVTEAQKIQNQILKSDSLTYKTCNKAAVDTSKYSIKISGQSNLVTINGQVVKSNNDSISKNKINVSGEENKISVIQTNTNSQVIITQKGGNNKVIISQSK